MAYSCFQSLFLKYETMPSMHAKCRGCKTLAIHEHYHRYDFGNPNTHQRGSERFECTRCGLYTRANGPRSKGLVFVLDGK